MPNLSEPKFAKELKDEELEKVNGGITQEQALNQNTNRPCLIYVEVGDDSYSWRDATFIANYTGGTFARVLYKGNEIQVSLSNIKFN